MGSLSKMLRVSLIVLAASLIPSESRAQQTDLELLAERNAAFGFDLYQVLRAKEGNLFLSPYNISTALAMTYAGARGQTEREMAEVLHFPPEQSALHHNYSGLQSHMNGIQERGRVRLHVANSLWYQKDQHFLETYFNLVRTHYGGGLNPVDFARNTEAARGAINSWVEDKTERKITNLIRPGLLGRSTALVLCNAIYFKGNWARRFDPEFTREADFHVTRDRVVKVPMMSGSAEFKWKVYEGFRAIELPYEGSGLSMVILLPDSMDGLTDLERSLTGESVRSWIQELIGVQPSEIAVHLPRFSTSAEFELAEVLTAMGMPGAFTGADFSGMTGNRDLSISEVVHKAYVDVNEEGTEAAAATGVVMKRGGAVFLVDRPFLFLIRENDTGSILFIGRIIDPSM